ncbi:MAG: RNA methyltransferase [Acidobacteria bacterium]|nr:RNA methyltransferase [Acidobacteriota bacterium]MBI3427030.1 RNA methyltransferase [Acidobacteriota bacterium]
MKLMLITSPANERLKHARRVREGREPELIFVEGERLVEECLQAQLPLLACFHEAAPAARTQAILAELQRRGCPLYPTTAAVLATLSDTVNPQGVVVLAQRPTTGLTQMLTAPHPLIVALDAVQDPGNFGTIVRTAEAAGASGVVALKGSVDAFAPKTLRSAMGSAFRLPIVSGLTDAALLAQARAAGLKVLATAATAAMRYDQFDWRQPALLVFGNEAHGVSQALLDACDAQISIPLQAPVESLNVAAAAAAILFEAARQRRSWVRTASSVRSWQEIE